MDAATPVMRQHTDEPALASVAAPGAASYRQRSDISEQELGVPIYPGARSITGGTWSMSGGESEGAESLTTVRLQTDDPIEQVADFYRSQLQPNPTQTFELNSVKGKTISLTTDIDTHSSSNVILRESGHGTRIDINVMGLKQKNVPDANDRVRG